MSGRLAHYRIKEKLYDGSHSIVYRGQHISNNRKVVLKLLKEEYPTPEEVAKFKREFEITRDLGSKVEGVISVYGIEKHENSLVMILEDFGGESLCRLQRQHRLKMDLPAFLHLAIRLSEILADVHRREIIHKDINPSNIIYHPKTDKLKIIDFGISTVLPYETVGHTSPGALEGTLAYISPEQTGRMNRFLDFRTDLYSLGVTLYELLTARLPFETDDAMEMVHAHLAKTPPDPAKIKPGVPGIVSKIIMKLMAKNAEDRYQCALGLKHDLQKCLDALNAGAKCKVFTLGKKEISPRFQVPQKLYGRHKEIKELLDAFERTSRGTTQMMLVAGFSGIGKTSLVQEVYRPIAQKRGYFIAGKFDQFKRNTPYASLIEAFQELIRQLLTESEARVARWKAKILEALGANGQVVTDVIPEVELIIGKQEPVQKLPPPQAQNRFNRVFQDFVRVFAAKEHPLTIYLDDLQWIDLSSLKLIELLMSAANGECLFLIGAYRDNEVDESHPLSVAIRALHERGTNIHTINLPPLGLTDVNRLLADTLHCSLKKTRPLARLCVLKTGGNPFFLKQFLHTIHQQGLIVFDSGTISWRWDEQKIEETAITENVVDLMVGKIRKMPARAQDAVKFAAAIGTRFSLKTLSIVNRKTARENADHLWAALRENLILPGDERYKFARLSDQGGFASLAALAEFRFAHDRIQQAAYSLIDESKRADIHLRIGRSLLEKIPKENQEDQVFDIVNHLNLGAERVKERSERMNLARLNLIAGEKAKDAIAYEDALKFFARGIGLLGRNCWKSSYRLTFDLYRNYAESLYLCGDISESEQAIFDIMEKLQSPLDKARLYNQLLILYTMKAKYKEAIDLTFEAMSILNIDFYAPDYKEALQKEISAIQARLRKRSIASLIELPEIEKQEIRVGIAILSDMLPICYFINQDLYAFAIARAINLALRYGHIAEMALVYVSYGMILASKYKKYSAAYEFGRLALDLSAKFNNDTQRCKTAQNFANHIYIWKKHISGAKKINAMCFEAGMNAGELQFPGYGRNNQALNRYFQGEAIDTLLSDIQDYLAFTKKTENLIATDTLDSVDLVLRNLGGETGSISSFHNRDFRSASAFIRQCTKRNSSYAVCAFLVHQAQLFYLFEEYQKAAAAMTRAKELIVFMPGSIVTVEQNFYESLLLLRLCADRPKESSKELEIVKENQEQMKIWADNCPGNFLNLYLLVEAETARVKGSALAAMTLYDQAVSSAKENGFIQNEALANELAAKFYLELGLGRIARLHVTNAYYGYRMWGARRKMRHVEERYPQLISGIADERRLFLEAARQKSIHTTSTEKMETGSSMQIFDLMTFLKASETLASEIALEVLLETMMRIVLENAGAERGIFLLEEGGKMVPQAVGAVDDSRVSIWPSITLAELEAGGLPPILSNAVVNYAANTKKSVILHDAARQGQFIHDEYIEAEKPKSILCMPLVYQGELIGILYLENNLAVGAFTQERVQILELLSAQMAISIKNARIHDRLEESVEKRTAELTIINETLRSEIAERRKAEKQLHAAAITDDLTGIYNRRGFFALTEQQCKLANRTKRRMSLLYLDLDDLKVINDRFGHQEGDVALQDTAAILKNSFRESDIIGRIGGDEFAVLLTEHTDLDIERIVTANVSGHVRTHNAQGGRKFRLSFSMGMAHFDPAQPCSVGELLSRADAAMYNQKKYRKSESAIPVIQTSRAEDLERRSDKRFEVHPHYWSKLDDSDKLYIKNISIGGLCLKTPQQLPQESVYKITISPAIAGRKTFEGIVVWSSFAAADPRSGEQEFYYETGLKFVNPADAQLDPLEEFLDKSKTGT